MIVYKITNQKTGKIYVGKTKGSIENRFQTHKKNAKNKINRYLYDSMNHHGFDSFAIEEIEKCSTDEDLNDRERYWILELNTLIPNGYNMTEGGDGGYTLKSWPEEKRKAYYKAHGEARRGKKRSEEACYNISVGAVKREQEKTHDVKIKTASKISQTLKKKYKNGLKAKTPEQRKQISYENFKKEYCD